MAGSLGRKGLVGLGRQGEYVGMAQLLHNAATRCSIAWRHNGQIPICAMRKFERKDSQR